MLFVQLGEPDTLALQLFSKIIPLVFDSLWILFDIPLQGRAFNLDFYFLLFARYEEVPQIAVWRFWRMAIFVFHCCQHSCFAVLQAPV